jgi:hypothetical protein
MTLVEVACTMVENYAETRFLVIFPHAILDVSSGDDSEHSSSLPVLVKNLSLIVISIRIVQFTLDFLHSIDKYALVNDPLLALLLGFESESPLAVHGIIVPLAVIYRAILHGDNTLDFHIV